MKYKTLCHFLARIEKTSKRLEIISIFQEIFSNNDDLYEQNDEPIHDKIIYLCQGRLYPDYNGKPELNLAQELAKKALIKMTMGPFEGMLETLKKTGDLGKTFYLLKKNYANKYDPLASLKKELNVSDIYNKLVDVAAISGRESQRKKIEAIVNILHDLSPLESRYLGRFVDGKMRLGINDLTMIEAVARMIANNIYDQSASREIIERAYNIYPDLGHVIKTALLDGIDALKAFEPQLNIPIRSMLAQRLETPEDIIEKHSGAFAVEYKLDGERLQVHKRGNEITLFSRRQEVITSQFPDVVENVLKYVITNEIILDGEVVAIEPGTGRLKEFQVLMRRRRKYGVDEKKEEIPTRVYFFDVLLCEGKSLLDTPYLERRAILEQCISMYPPQDNIMPVPQRIVQNLDELVEYFNKAIADGTEGLLTKSIKEESVYQPGARGWLWIKLKSLQRGKLPDSIDVVVVGVNWGEGRRASQYGTLLVAVKNEDTGNFEMLTRVSSGMDDEKAEFFLNNLKVIPSCPKNVKTSEEPDKWIEPTTVLEIIGDEITESPNTVIGYSIRFPRIVRIRDPDDKGPDDITTVEEVLSMRTATSVNDDNA